MDKINRKKSESNTVEEIRHQPIQNKPLDPLKRAKDLSDLVQKSKN